jgi:hypothetical protein
VKNASDKAVDLPLEPAPAILTDANGTIEMKVPVTRDVDNPDFDLSGVIADAFVNLLIKAITAPFTLLANLVSSEEDSSVSRSTRGPLRMVRRNTSRRCASCCGGRSASPIWWRWESAQKRRSMPPLRNCEKI